MKVKPPPINVETQAFWDATAKGKLLVKQCRSCSEYHYYPRTMCPFCFSDDTVWQESSGNGVIYSWTVMRRVPEPYAVAYVTLEEGITMLTNLIDCDLDSLAVGQAVQVKFVDTGEGSAIPFFTLA